MAINLSPLETNIRRIVEAVRQLTQGRSDAVLEVTLTPNAATTVVTAINCGPNSEIFFTPRTANAAAAIATTFVLAGNVGQGSLTISHANNAQTDRTFAIICLGG